MKKNLALMLCCCLFFVFAGYSNAQSPVDKVITGQAAENMKNVLANLGWIADGRDKGRHLYVLFSTSCVYCSVLFEKARDFTDKVQVRWIPVSADGSLDYMFDNPTRDTLAAGFAGDETPQGKNAESTARTRQYNFGAIQFYLAAQMLTDGPSSGFALPTMLYPGSNSVSIIRGLPSDMMAVVKNIPQGEAASAGFVPTAYAHSKEPITTLPIKVKEYVNEHKEDMPIFLTPFDGAPKLGSILAGSKQGVPILGVTENGFALLSVDGKNTAGFIKDEQFVKKALAGE